MAELMGVCRGTNGVNVILTCGDNAQYDCSVFTSKIPSSSNRKGPEASGYCYPRIRWGTYEWPTWEGYGIYAKNRWIGKHYALWPNAKSNDCYTGWYDGSRWYASGKIAGVNFAVGDIYQLQAYSWSGSSWFHYATYSTFNGNEDNGGLTVEYAFKSNINAIPVNGGTVQHYFLYNNKTYTVDQETYNNLDAYHLGNEQLKYKAIANDHFKFVSWTINGIENFLTEDALFTLPANDAYIYANFEQYEFTTTVKKYEDLEGIGVITNANGEEVEIVEDWQENGYSYGTFTATLKEEYADLYRFKGWYMGYGQNLSADECTNLVDLGAKTISVSSLGRDVTYVAKFTSRQTTLSVTIDEISTGVGTFDVYYKGTLVADHVTSYENADCLDGNLVRVIAYPGSDPASYLRYWTIPYDEPNGTASTQTAKERDISFLLSPREVNNVTALFYEKLPFDMSGYVDGPGYVTYTGNLGGGGMFSNYLELENVYIETDYVFTPTSTDKLYGFDKWMYLAGTDWITLTEKHEAVQLFDGDKVVIRFEDDYSEESFALKAVFSKLETYVIPTPVIQGGHAVNGNEASAVDSGCYFEVNDIRNALPEADEVVDGEGRWLKTELRLRATAGAKWKFSKWLITTASEGEQTFTNAATNYTVTEDVLGIVAIFEARKYKVTVKVDSASVSVGQATVTYLSDIVVGGEEITTSDPVDVLVDTPITIKAFLKDGYSAPTVTKDDDGNETITINEQSADFYDWTYNEIATQFEAEHTLNLVGDCDFVARFSVAHTFELDGFFTNNEVTYALGAVDVTYTTDGYQTTQTLDADTKTFRTLLVCGSSFDLVAEPKQIVTESGVEYTGHFVGWFEKDFEKQTYAQLQGWGLELDDVSVGSPRVLQAQFSVENRWPILRLRQPAEGVYCAFTVSGARTERVQQISDNETVELTDPNDYFCDAFSVVQIRLEKYNSGDKFLHWKQMEFAPNEDGTYNEIGIYSYSQDLSIFMTGNLHLVPVFWTGNPIQAEASYATGSDSTMGDISLDGEPISKEEDGKIAYFAQDDEATFVASPRNGYKFVGWSSDSQGKNIISTLVRYTVKMDTTRRYYANFAQDREAIYTFGTSNATKTMTWRSKRVEVNTPTSFSAVQVDAEGYEDVVLTVYHASSPSVPYKMNAYSITHGNSKRLTLGARGEKLFEFEIKSHQPVNSVTVATSVTSLLTNG